MQSTEQEGTFSFQAGVDGFLHVECTRIPKQEGISSKPADVGLNPETTSTAQVTDRQKFAKLPRGRQRRGVTTWSTEQTKQFDPGE